MSSEHRKLLAQLNYQFKDSTLLARALRHRSAGANNNERLEFLGDALIGLVIGEALLKQFPHADEGVLSRLRASLVKGETLAKIARQLDLGKYLVLGVGELKSGGFNRDSILADAMEALFGAVYLDSDFLRAREVVLGIFAPLLSVLDRNTSTKDPKTQLQEWLQARKHPLPEYVVVATLGDPHNQVFHVECHLQHAQQVTQGKGDSRRHAEQDAAAQMLKQLGA